MPNQQLFVFNVAKAGPRHTCEVPNDTDPLLPTFSSALSSARKHGYIVQGAMYGPTGATIFIDTEDKNWHQRVDSDIPEDIKNIITVPRKATKSADAGSQALDPQPSVQIFEVGNMPSQIITASESDEEPQLLLKEFVDAIHALLANGDLVQCAMYSAQEGAKIFVSDSDE